jgi:hypothetical protein
MTIDPNWNFEEAVQAVYNFYNGDGVMARGRQYNVLRNWGNVVGKKRALGDLQNYIRKCKTKKNAAMELGVSVRTLRSLELFFEDLPEKKFDVALSFAGEEREYVEKVAASLFRTGINVFYDQYEEVDMWGKNLTTHLESIFSTDTACVVIFASNNYSKKAFPCLEKDAALATAINSRKEYILMGKFDDTQIYGILPTIKYIDLRKVSADEFASLIIQKLKKLRII